MKKLILIFILFNAKVHSQELRLFTFYGEFGYGYSKTAFTSANGGIAINLAITGGYDNWLVKYARRLNNESALIAPQEKINANSFLIGRSFILHQSINDTNDVTLEWNLTGYIGYSSIENQKRGKVLHSDRYTTTYEHIVEHGNGVPIELELQCISPHFQAGAISVFYNVNEFRNYYGINLMIFGGYF